MKLHEFIYTSIFIFPKVNTRAIYNDKGRKEGIKFLREKTEIKKSNKFYFFADRYFVPQNNKSTLMERD